MIHNLWIRIRKTVAWKPQVLHGKDKNLWPKIFKKQLIIAICKSWIMTYNLWNISLSFLCKTVGWTVELSFSPRMESIASENGNVAHNEPREFHQSIRDNRDAKPSNQRNLNDRSSIEQFRIIQLNDCVCSNFATGSFERTPFLHSLFLVKELLF